MKDVVNLEVEGQVEAIGHLSNASSHNIGSYKPITQLPVCSCREL